MSQLQHQVPYQHQSHDQGPSQHKQAPNSDHAHVGGSNSSSLLDTFLQDEDAADLLHAIRSWNLHKQPRYPEENRHPSLVTVMVPSDIVPMENLKSDATIDNNKYSENHQSEIQAVSTVTSLNFSTSTSFTHDSTLVTTTSISSTADTNNYNEIISNRNIKKNNHNHNKGNSTDTLLMTPSKTTSYRGNYSSKPSSLTTRIMSTSSHHSNIYTTFPDSPLNTISHHFADPDADEMEQGQHIVPLSMVHVHSMESPLKGPVRKISDYDDDDDDAIEELSHESNLENFISKPSSLATRVIHSTSSLDDANTHDSNVQMAFSDSSTETMLHPFTDAGTDEMELEQVQETLPLSMAQVLPSDYDEAEEEEQSFDCDVEKPSFHTTRIIHSTLSMDDTSSHNSNIQKTFSDASTEIMPDPIDPDTDEMELEQEQGNVSLSMVQVRKTSDDDDGDEDQSHDSDVEKYSSQPSPLITQTIHSTSFLDDANTHDFNHQTRYPDTSTENLSHPFTDPEKGWIELEQEQDTASLSMVQVRKISDRDHGDDNNDDEEERSHDSHVETYSSKLSPLSTQIIHSIPFIGDAKPSMEDGNTHESNIRTAFSDPSTDTISGPFDPDTDEMELEPEQDTVSLYLANVHTISTPSKGTLRNTSNNDYDDYDGEEEQSRDSSLEKSSTPSMDDASSHDSNIRTAFSDSSEAFDPDTDEMELEHEQDTVSANVHTISTPSKGTVRKASDYDDDCEEEQSHDSNFIHHHTMTDHHLLTPTSSTTMSVEQESIRLITAQAFTWLQDTAQVLGLERHEIHLVLPTVQKLVQGLGPSLETFARQDVSQLVSIEEDEEGENEYEDDDEYDMKNAHIQKSPKETIDFHNNNRSYNDLETDQDDDRSQDSSSHTFENSTKHPEVDTTDASLSIATDTIYNADPKLDRPDTVNHFRQTLVDILMIREQFQREVYFQEDSTAPFKAEFSDEEIFQIFQDLIEREERYNCILASKTQSYPNESNDSIIGNHLPSSETFAQDGCQIILQKKDEDGENAHEDEDEHDKENKHVHESPKESTEIHNNDQSCNNLTTDQDDNRSQDSSSHNFKDTNGMRNSMTLVSPSKKSDGRQDDKQDDKISIRMQQDDPVEKEIQKDAIILAFESSRKNRKQKNLSYPEERNISMEQKHPAFDEKNQKPSMTMDTTYKTIPKEEKVQPVNRFRRTFMQPF